MTYGTLQDLARGAPLPTYKSAVHDADTAALFETAIQTAQQKDVGVVFLAVDASRRPEIAGKIRPLAPVSYADDHFSERDLLSLQGYLLQDFRGGWRQR